MPPTPGREIRGVRFRGEDDRFSSSKLVHCVAVCTQGIVLSRAVNKTVVTGKTDPLTLDCVQLMYRDEAVDWPGSSVFRAEPAGESAYSATIPLLGTKAASPKPIECLLSVINKQAWPCNYPAG